MRQFFMKLKVMNKYLFIGMTYLIMQNSPAQDIGARSIIGNVTNRSGGNLPSTKEIWSAHWKLALNVCRKDFKKTKSVIMTSYQVNDSNPEFANIKSLWTCRDNP